MESGKPDTSFPDRNIPESALFIYDCLGIQPSSYYAIDHPIRPVGGGNVDAHNMSGTGIELSNLVEPHEPTLAALRSLAHRVLEKKGRNRLDTGMWHLFFCNQGHTSASIQMPDPLDHKPGTLKVFDGYLGKAFGMAAGEVASTRREAHAQLEELADKDEWRLIVSGIEQLKAEAAFPWEESTAPSNAKKRRNKKKKAEKGKKVDGEAADGDEEKEKAAVEGDEEEA